MKARYNDWYIIYYPKFPNYASTITNIIDYARQYVNEDDYSSRIGCMYFRNKIDYVIVGFMYIW